MILYKYVGFHAGMAILQNNSIGFSQPKYFNDPAELEASYPINDYSDTHDLLEMTRRREMKKLAWKEYSAILSLTRASNNPLMWSHYSEKHKGFVIGFEVNQEVFTSEEKNLLPVQFGNVIYTATKPIHEFLANSDYVIEVGSEVSFKFEMLERLQRMYLYKPMYWSYEEEVRVVKNIFSKDKKGNLLSDISEITKVDSNDLYILKLPLNTIKEVYLGLRNRLNNNKNGEFKSLIEHSRTFSENINFFECRQEDSSWYIRHIELT